MVFIVSYDLNRPGQNYEGLLEEIRRSPGWLHPMQSTWLIYTNESAQQLSDRLLKYIDGSDRLILMPASKPVLGWLTQESWDWINKYV